MTSDMIFVIFLPPFCSAVIIIFYPWKCSFFIHHQNPKILPPRIHPVQSGPHYISQKNGVLKLWPDVFISLSFLTATMGKDPCKLQTSSYQVLKLESSLLPSAVFSHWLPRKRLSYTVCVCLHVLHWWISNGIFAEAASARGHGDSLSRREGVCSFKGLAKVRSSQVALVAKNLPADAGDVRDVDSINGSGRFGGGLGDLHQ